MTMTVLVRLSFQKHDIHHTNDTIHPIQRMNWIPFDARRYQAAVQSCVGNVWLASSRLRVFSEVVSFNRA